MDEADRADQRIEEVISDGIARARRYPSLIYTGMCYWCGGITGGGRLFCDADCRDDCEREQRMRRMARS